MKKEEKVSYAPVKRNTHWPAKVICIMDAHQPEAGSQVKVMDGTKEKIQHIWTVSPKEGSPSSTPLVYSAHLIIPCSSKAQHNVKEHSH